MLINNVNTSKTCHQQSQQINPHLDQMSYKLHHEIIFLGNCTISHVKKANFVTEKIYSIFYCQRQRIHIFKSTGNFTLNKEQNTWNYILSFGIKFSQCII